MGRFRLSLLISIIWLSACNFPRQPENPLQTAIALTVTAHANLETTKPAATIDTAGTNPEPLPTQIAQTLTAAPTFSPTGATEDSPQTLSEPSGQIVYVCQFSKRSGFNQICIINADGSQQRVLTNSGSDDDFFPSISRDGKSVYFASDRSGRYQIYRLSLISGDLEQLTSFNSHHAYAPTESPDGAMIAFYARRSGEEYPGSHSIWLMDHDGGRPRQITFLDGGGWDPAWSPDGRHLLFAAQIDRDPQLFIVDVLSLEIQQVTHLEGIRGRNDWSPNGYSLATYIGSPWDRDIYTFDLEGGNLTQLTDGDNNLAPSFSPDGTWITFMSYRDHPREDLGCEIYIMRVDGSDVRRLTNNDICDWQPRWGN